MQITLQKRQKSHIAFRLKIKNKKQSQKPYIKGFATVFCE